jgi:hypothetical protein
MPSFGLLYMGKLCGFFWVAQNTPIWPVLPVPATFWTFDRTAHYCWTGHKPGSGFFELRQYCITIGSETTFLSELCVIQSPSYLVWSRTFLLGVGLTDLGHFGRYFGQNKEIVSVFNGSVVYFKVGIGLTFLGRCCSTRQELYFQLFV